MLTAEALERRLGALAGRAAHPAQGLFGPNSMTWRVDREASVFLGAGRALLLQLAHPWVAAAIAEHSRTLQDPIGRFHRTFDAMFTMVFGTVPQALDAARRLHLRHAGVSGRVPAAAGPFAAGSGYLANEPAALTWVYATLVETAPLAYGLVQDPLGRAERELYYSESHLLAELFGLEPRDLPPDWDAFAAYNARMHGSDTLTVTREAREIGRGVLSGARRLPRAPAWYLAVTASLLPERLREGYGLAYGEPERRSAERALAWLGRVYPRLPERLRTVGPYQEAVGRLSGKPRPGRLTRGLNRLWIGRAGLDRRPSPSERL